MQKLQPLKTLLLLLVITLLAAFLAACSTESSSTTPVTPDAPDIPNPVAGEAAFMLNLDKLVIDRAQVTAHFTNALLKADLEKKGNYSGTASISSITTGGEFTTNGNTYASNVTLTLSGELEAHSLALAEKITAYSTVYSNLRSSNVVDLAGFNRIPLPSSSSNYMETLLVELDSAAFDGRTVSIAHGAGELATNALTFSTYNGAVAYLLPNNSSLQNLTNAVSVGLRVVQSGKTLREEFKRYSVSNNPAFKGDYNLTDYPKTSIFAVKEGENITLTYLYKLTKGDVGDYESFDLGRGITTITGSLLRFTKTAAVKGTFTDFAAVKDTFNGIDAVTPQNANAGNSPDHLYQNTFTLLNRKAGAPTVGPALLNNGLYLGLGKGHTKAGFPPLRFDAR